MSPQTIEGRERFESDLGEYLAGRPLAPWLADVREGREPGIEPGDAPEGKLEAAAGRMTRKKRLLLRDVTREPGWQVFEELLAGLGEKREKEAVELSKDDPISNEKAIAAEWAYVATDKRVLTDIRAKVRALTSDLDEEAKRGV